MHSIREEQVRKSDHKTKESPMKESTMMESPIAPDRPRITVEIDAAKLEEQRKSQISPLSLTQQPRVGPYALTKTLGVGSTGKVKLGIHMETGTKVAVKIFSKEALIKKKLDVKVEREITIMKLINHPSILHLFDVYETDVELFLVMEFVEGGELFDYLVAKKRLQEQEARKFFRQIISALDFCHQHLIFHRDLKPENLLLDKELNIKIADFGMAALQLEGKMLTTSCGSPHYACPEIIRGEKYDGAPADIWSCGIILFALLVGYLPFDDPNVRVLLSKVKAGVFSIPPHVSPAAADLIKRMLVLDSSKRITIPEIYAHPWFQGGLQEEKKKSVKEEESKSTLYRVLRDSHSLTKQQDIDPDILQKMSFLGWQDQKTLIELLLASEDNLEKVFYHLLAKRKKQTLEMTEISRLSVYELNSPARKRQESIFLTPEEYSPHSPHYTTSLNGGNVVKQSLLNLNEDGTALRSLIPKKNHEFASMDTLANHSKIFSSNRPSSPSSPSRQSPLSIEAKSPIFTADSSSSSCSSLKKIDSTCITAPPDSPKKSTWFQNIFKFKAESRICKSPFPSIEQSFMHCVKRLKTANILHEQYKENAIKCKFNLIKFKIEFSEEGSGVTLIKYTHQQGPIEQFNHIFEILKE